nr:MAG TPA: hypothetical protein [Caudoviricetes sp.]
MKKNETLFGKLISNTVTVQFPVVADNESVLYDAFHVLKSEISTTGYSEMIQYVTRNFSKILTLATSKKSRSLRIISDKDFLIALDLSRVQFLRNDISKFNRIYRAYIINPEKNVIYSQESADVFYRIAFRINKKMVQIVMNLGISEKDALWLIVNRYSAFDERRNIKRMVRAIQHMDPKIVTEQMIVDIFSKTFNDQFENLFIAVMTDRFDSFDDKNEQYVYSTVSNAVLDILDTMDEDEIRDILINYENELSQSGTSGRFSLKTINSGDYPNICEIIKELHRMGINID